MRFLKTNTATRVTVGPFLDKTDGITPETALTVTSCKVTLMVDDGGVPTLVIDASATASGGDNDMVHVTNDDAGFYDLELTAAQLNYVGRAMLAITDAATHCPVFHEFMILPAVVYDSLVGGTDKLQVDTVEWLGTACATPTVAGVPEVDITHIGGDSQSQIDLKDFADSGYDPATNKVEGVKLVDTTTTNTDMRGTDNAATAANLETLAGYVDTEVATILTAIQDATSGLIALNTDLDTLLSRLTAARAGYLDNLSGGAAALAADLATALAALTDLQARLPAALVGGRLKSLVEAYAAGQDPATLLLVTPANKLATDAAGKVTVDDKTGYSLAVDQAVNVTKINGSADAAAQLGRSAATIANGAAIAGVLTTTEMTTNLTFAVPEQMNGRTLIFAPDTATAALRRQATNITGTMASGKLTFTALTTAPVIGDTFVIV